MKIKNEKTMLSPISFHMGNELRTLNTNELYFRYALSLVYFNSVCTQRVSQCQQCLHSKCQSMSAVFALKESVSINSACTQIQSMSAALALKDSVNVNSAYTQSFSQCKQCLHSKSQSM